MTHQLPDTPASPAAVADLAASLAEQRALAQTRRRDALARRWDAAMHRIGLADVRERAAVAARQRRERRRDAAEAVELAELYRRAEISGERARLAARIQQSAEVRALRINRVRSVSLKAGIPVLAAFAAWSTAGVHRGVTTVLGLTEGSPGWWAAWGVEPALISIVALVILGRAWLRSAGGDVDWRATAAEWSALAASVVLNVAGAWPATLTGEAVAPLVAHSIGPAGCAATAWLIATFDSYVRNADPFEGAQTLAGLGIDRPRAGALDGAEAPAVPPVEPAAPEVAPAVDAAPAQGAGEPEVAEEKPAAPVVPMRPRVSDAELEARAREVYRPGMPVTEFRKALGVGMKKAHPLHKALRAEQEQKESTG
ncbi:hypothetical protein [Streptomonospora nanhaiensis]|uniref:hypothetical protein n=1 Tax=Streptomonospora nanhaiensis TaxID=1323731 RepID=UPI001C387DAB|nr:hypothetical protein [Streptomonospora nanhaiensis]MBV2364234.1 hypothetical protein [Streptomonospora nanhaiensis]